MTDADIVLRLRQLENEVDRLRSDREILELLARYGYNADLERDDEWVALWAEDASFDSRRPGDFHVPSLRGHNRFEGRDGLRRFLSDPEGHHDHGYGRRIHVQGLNPVIHYDGDEAIVNDNWLVLLQNGGQIVVLACGNDQWRLRKAQGEWSIVERRVRHVGGEEYRTNLDATPR